ncbi:MAG: hypothetical protein COT92_01845 [Candidatus Doudnabacteria bacterium CG10_big_fil_rev_8_21_14_0_10_42_18]|uniref:Uncharacterized protein n=1 Tax=Candidatus Doudnabacteria bacterium CG10_big_fil_rev_8_21_14_0_10_42_18 TaxID=1974552 RepID=A0A2H0VB38_9BACT|nr:MAG: hypothetical protein COT92_01845 [Candidatus Doudnabacteria bacterium CG10_big_fil_rev_8_21_14_0_10_42_18]
MNIKLIGETLDVLGKLMIAYTAISVHWRFRKEHKVDDVVFKEMRREQIIGIMGMILLIVGYLLRNFF